MVVEKEHTNMAKIGNINRKMTGYLDQLFDFRRNQQFKKMRFSEFVIERVIQKGEKNEVLLVSNRKHTTLGKFVLKKLDNRLNKQQFVQNEINVGKKFKKSSIAKMLHYWVEGDYTYLLFEWIDGVDLYDYLAEGSFEPLTEELGRFLFRQIVKSVKYVHKKGFVHGDLKLENVMLDRNHKKIKLIDFGFCTEANCKSVLTNYQGSLEYLAPEVLKRIPYQACKSEVWSLGVILFTLLFGEFPFSEHDRNDGFEGVEVSFPCGGSSSSRDLLTHMLALSPDDRYELEDVIRHPWMNE